MGDASQGKTRVLGSFLTIYMEQIEINGAGGSVTVVANPWVRRFPVSVRGPRSMAPCVAHDRWHRACPAIDGTVRGPREILTVVGAVPGLFFDDLHGRNRDKRCRRERHGSRGGFRFPCVCPCVRGPRSMAPCMAREKCKCKNTK